MRNKVQHRITTEKQLSEWVRGNSLHRRVASKYAKGGKCTPDFSCCIPELLAEEGERRAYATGSRSQQVSFLGVFLRRALERRARLKGKNAPTVHIIDGSKPPREN
jgi:hypothetical protein